MLTKWKLVEVWPDWICDPPSSYRLVFTANKMTGDAIYDKSTDPWPDVCRAICDEYGCDVMVHMPEGHDPAKILFKGGQE